MSDKEMKFVTRQETFNDLAVRELAKGRSACICRLQFGRCTREECKKCEIYKQYARCYEELSDYDRQRLATYINENYQQDSLWPDKWRPYTGLLKWQMLKFFGLMAAILVMLVLVALFIGLALSCPADQPPEPSISNKIASVMVLNKTTIQDYNEDGEINCIDYACGFKWHWDKMYPELADDCKLVRNKNEATGMHHLFAHIYAGYIDIEVEPWAYNPLVYSMQANWTDGRYDPKYNIYGETERWMKTCERRLNR